VSPENRKLLGDAAKELGIDLSLDQIDKFDIFSKELQRWNSKLNLTSLKDPSDIILKHYIDSLTISPLITSGSKLLDIGSGGGFPSIPLKIVRQDIDVLSVDSVQKKINFQRQVARLIGIENFRAVHSRIEDLFNEFAGTFDFVVARAVADISILARMATQFLSDGGRLIAMKGVRWKEELDQSESEFADLGLFVEETRELRLPFIGDVRGLILLRHEKS